MEKLQIPLALVADNLTGCYGTDPVTGAKLADGSLDRAVGGLAAAHGEARRIYELGEALRGDGTLTSDAAALKLRQNALAAGDRAAKALDGARADLVATIGQIEAQTAAPPLLLGAGPVEVEIRAALRGMSKSARAAALREAFSDGDDQIMGAALRGNAVTVGLEKGEQDHWRTRYRYERCRPEALRIERLNKAVAALDRAGASLIAFTRKAADTQQALAAENAAGRSTDILNQLAS